MTLPEPNRRVFLGLAAAAAVVVAGGRFRVALAQSADDVLDPILGELVWRDAGEFRRLQRLIWTTYELKYIYRGGFEERTELELPESGQYANTIEQLAGKYPDQIAANVPVSRLQLATPSFQSALEQNAPMFLDWLESVGVAPEGPLATGLLQGQVLLSLLDLLLRGFDTLEARGAADDDCAIFYPFC